MITKKRDHITPVLARIHRLPVTARIQFKITLLTFKTLTTHQPSYIHDLLQLHCSSRQLRSTSHNLLEIPRMRTGFAQCSFTYSASHIWNSLPHIITVYLDVTANTFKMVLAMALCLSVCPSVTSRSSTKMAKRRITQTKLHDSPGTLVFWSQRSPRNSTGVTPYGGAKCRWGGSKLATFDK